jgi:hypothetical protein
MKQNLPSRNEVIEKIELALAQQLSREELSDWAFNIYNDDMLEVTDKAVWKVLSALVGCDSYGFDRPYLYVDDDLNNWMSLLK